MIPKDFIKNWRQEVNWLFDRQVEQDLVISRALVALYNHPGIAASLAFRGGTALNKLFFSPATRYSEDLDFVQINDEPIGKTLSNIRSVLDPWLGEAKWSQKQRSVKLVYRFDSEDSPAFPMRLKIEINSVEPFSVYGFTTRNHTVDSPWFSGNSEISTYCLEELMATKLRALFQRSKGRDLFDLWIAVRKYSIDCDKVIKGFKKYNEHHGTIILPKQFEENISNKMADPTFLNDIVPLLAEGVSWNENDAWQTLKHELLSRL
jgi:predicted nucleotidyltransferase component of viral defense system